MLGPPLLRAEPLTVEPRALPRGIGAFATKHVHACVREVVQASGVVEIQVRQHDVAHVAEVETQTRNLARRCHLFAEVRTDEEQEECAEAALRVRNIAQAKPCVDEGQSLAPFDQDAMARQFASFEDAAAASIHETAAERACRNAVEMMQAHGRPPGTENIDACVTCVAMRDEGFAIPVERRGNKFHAECALAEPLRMRAQLMRAVHARSCLFASKPSGGTGMLPKGYEWQRHISSWGREEWLLVDGRPVGIVSVMDDICYVSRISGNARDGWTTQRAPSHEAATDTVERWAVAHATDRD